MWGFQKPQLLAHTFDNIIKTTIEEVLKHVNRGRDTSLTDLLQSNLWNDTWIQFVSEVEDAVGLCRLDTKPLTTDCSLQKSIRGVFCSEVDLGVHHQGDFQR